MWKCVLVIFCIKLNGGLNFLASRQEDTMLSFCHLRVPLLKVNQEKFYSWYFLAPVLAVVLSMPAHPLNLAMVSAQITYAANSGIRRKIIQGLWIPAQKSVLLRLHS